MAKWPVLVPLGAMAVSAAGTTVSLAVNCGPLGGQIGNYQNPTAPGQALRQIILTNKGTGNAFLLPRGSTASGNAGNIMAYIPSGATVSIPYGMPFENGILPENFVLDGDAACTVYGCGVLS